MPRNQGKLPVALIAPSAFGNTALAHAEPARGAGVLAPDSIGARDGAALSHPRGQLELEGKVNAALAGGTGAITEG
jgi:hypothetical protein